MRSNALKKEEYFEDVTVNSKKTAPKSAMPKSVMKLESTYTSWETFRESIAQQTAAALNLPGNFNCPDFEEFLFKGEKPKTSDFA